MFYIWHTYDVLDSGALMAISMHMAMLQVSNLWPWPVGPRAYSIVKEILFSFGPIIIYCTRLLVVKSVM